MMKMPTSFIEDKEHYRAPRLVPTAFQSRICMCPNPNYEHDRKFMKMNHCGTCHKPYRWYLRRCRNCKEWYIKDFRHGLTESKFWCWTCLGVDVNSPGDFAPLGLNPKRYTSEELESFDLFASPFD